jgi:hypothetical protein
VVAFVALGSANSAAAASVQLDLAPGDDGPAATVSYFAGPGEFNRVRVQVERAASQPTYVVFSDVVRLGVGQTETAAGQGCELVSDPARNPAEIRCPVPPEARSSTASIHLGDFEDYFQGPYDGRPVDASVFGGDGNDELTGASRLYGGPGPDKLYAVSPFSDLRYRESLLRGGPSSDYLEGGKGDDTIVPGPGLDRVSAAGGDDVILARDGATDGIAGAGMPGGALACGTGDDRIELDRYDLLAGTECEMVLRNGLPRALLVHDYFWDPLAAVVACPSDMPRTCVTRLLLRRRRGGHVVARAGARITPGTKKVVRFPYRELSYGRVTVLTERLGAPPLRYSRGLYVLDESE